MNRLTLQLFFAAIVITILPSLASAQVSDLEFGLLEPAPVTYDINAPQPSNSVIGLQLHSFAENILLSMQSDVLNSHDRITELFKQYSYNTYRITKFAWKTLFNNFANNLNTKHNQGLRFVRAEEKLAAKSIKYTGTTATQLANSNEATYKEVLAFFSEGLLVERNRETLDLDVKEIYAALPEMYLGSNAQQLFNENIHEHPKFAFTIPGAGADYSKTQEQTDVVLAGASNVLNKFVVRDFSGAYNRLESFAFESSINISSLEAPKFNINIEPVWLAIADSFKTEMDMYEENLGQLADSMAPQLRDVPENIFDKLLPIAFSSNGSFLFENQNPSIQTSKQIDPKLASSKLSKPLLALLQLDEVLNVTLPGSMTAWFNDRTDELAMLMIDRAPSGQKYASRTTFAERFVKQPAYVKIIDKFVNQQRAQLAYIRQHLVHDATKVGKVIITADAWLNKTAPQALDSKFAALEFSSNGDYLFERTQNKLEISTIAPQGRVLGESTELSWWQKIFGWFTGIGESVSSVFIYNGDGQPTVSTAPVSAPAASPTLNTGTVVVSDSAIERAVTAVLNRFIALGRFAFLKGETGPQGPQGETGARGAAGSSSVSSGGGSSFDSSELLIGDGSLDASAILQANSTSRGFLAPRMTSTERDAISSPATGLLVYNSTTNAFNVYNGTTWGAIGGGGADEDGTYIVQTAVNAPSNAQVLASLSTGLLKNTTTTGVLSVATAGTDYVIPSVSSLSSLATVGTITSGIWNAGALLATGSDTVGVSYTNSAGHALMKVDGAAASQAGYYIHKDGAEKVQIAVLGGSDDLTISMAGTDRFTISSTGNVQLDGDLTISGDDLFLGTNTSGYILVADGTNFNPVAMSGDIALASNGATTIGADKVLESHLKAVDSATDEECLTYESTTGDFEWQSCGSGASQWTTSGSNIYYNTGNVGIGTTSPQSPLHVKGSTSYGAFKISPSSDDGESSLGFTRDAAGTDNNDIWVIGQNAWGTTGNLFAIGNENNGGGGNIRLAITKAGNVGIGTTAPRLSLDVVSGSNPQIHISRTGADSGGYVSSNGAANLAMYGGGYWTGSNYLAKNAEFSGITYSDSVAGDISFVNATGLTPGNTFSPSLRMYIAAGGNVGVGGDATPDSLFSVGSSSQFQINSSGAIAAATGVTSSGTVTFSGLPSGAAAGVVLHGTGGALATLSYSSSNNGQCLVVTAGAPVWGSCASGSMSIGGSITSATQGSILFAGASGVLAQDNANFFWDDSLNYLGVGTAAPAAPLHISKSATGLTEVLRLQNGNAVAGDGPSIDFYWNTGTPMRGGRIGLVPINTSIGDLVFHTANGGAPTEKMRIEADGSVGIGTTNPAALLHLSKSGTGLTEVLRLQNGNTVAGDGPSIDFYWNTGSPQLGARIGINPTALAAADILFYTGNGSTPAERMRILANGNVAIGTTVANARLTILSANTTGTTTSSGMSLAVNSLTSGTGLYAASSSLTSGKLFDLQVSGTAATTNQTGLNILVAGATSTTAQTTYGAQISNTRTNATSGTNVALYLNASGATTANYGLLVNAGNVGIGTTAPATLLHTHGGHLTLGPLSTTVAAEIRMREGSNNGTEYVAFKAANAITTSVTWTLPSADGSNGQILQTNGSGTLSWTANAATGMTNPMTTTGDIVYASDTASPSTPARLGIGSAGQCLVVAAGLPSWGACSGSSAAAGSDTQVQFNNAGSFGGSADYVWNNTNATLSVLGSISGVKTSLALRNTHSGATSTNELRVGNDALADALTISVNSSTYTSAGNEALIYNRGSAALVFGTDNTERARIASSGNFGIGDASPAALLTVGSGDLFQVNSSGVIAAVTGYIQGSGTMSLTSANTTEATTDSVLALSANSLTTGTGAYFASSSLSSGKLFDLVVSGTAASSNTQTALNIATSGANGTSTQTTYGAQIANTHSGTSSTNIGLFVSASGGTNNYAAIFNAGNVGIGTSTPSATLSILSANTTGTTTSSGMSLAVNSLTTGTGMYVASSSLTSGKLVDIQVSTTLAASNTQTALNVATTGSNAATTQTTYGAQIANTHSGTSSTNVGLYVSASGATNNYAAIFNAGYVGIGTTTPVSNLTIGNNTSSGNITAFSEYQILLYNNASSAAGSYGMGVEPNFMWFNSDLGYKFYNDGANERMVIDSAGNIGIGTDTTPDAQLEIINTSAQNSFLIADDADGDATPFVVDASGNVGIGEATPAALLTVGSGDLFQVNSSGAITAATAIATTSSDLGNGIAGPVITIGRNTNATNTGAGSINFQSKAGTAGYVWQDNAGNLRIHTVAPTNANDTAGTVVGTQSSTRETKQNITSYTNYAEALQAVVSAPLHTFKYKKDVSGYGANSPLAKNRLGFIADEVDGLFMWGNAIDQVSVNGLLMGSIKALDEKISTLAVLTGNSNSEIQITPQVYVHADSVGQARIKAGSKTVRVSFAAMYQHQPIVTISPRGQSALDNSFRYSIIDEDESGFTIKMSSAQDEAVEFNWHAFASEGAKLSVSDGTMQEIELVLQASEPQTEPEPQVAGDSTTNDNNEEFTEPDPESITEDPSVEENESQQNIVTPEEEPVQEETTPGNDVEAPTEPAL